MDRTAWTDAHDRLLRYAEPPVSEPTGSELDQVWARVAGVLESDSGPSTRRRVRIGIAAGVGAVVLGTSGLAAADHFTARTGRGPVDAEDLRLGGPGEELALAAPDYGRVVEEETRDIPFPSAAARRFAVADQVRDAAGAGTDEFVTTGAVRAWVADAALCSWADQWAVATRSGDEDARDEAIRAVHDAPRWPAVAALDPHPSAQWKTHEVRDEQGVVTTERYLDESQFFYLEALARAVEGREPAAVARVLARDNGYCRPGNVPHLPGAAPIAGAR